jgi:acyl-CoA synthetase (AMP-forming)/AMP-acid ligase II
MLNLKQLGLTAYGIARQISGEANPTSNAFRQICHRWQRWLDNRGLKTLRLLEKDLEQLGQRLTIEPIKQGETKMMQVEQLSYDKLPHWAKALAAAFPDNGRGREDSEYLIIYENGQFIEMFSDSMEREDARFSRDLSWVMPAILEAYEAGQKAGQKNPIAPN